MAAGVSANPGSLNRPITRKGRTKPQGNVSREELGMEHFNVVTRAVCMRLLGLTDWLCGCSHRRTTFPITLRRSAGVNGQACTDMETYIACLECGRHLTYDWTRMRITRHGAAAVGRIADGQKIEPPPLSMSATSAG